VCVCLCAWWGWKAKSPRTRREERERRISFFIPHGHAPLLLLTSRTRRRVSSKRTCEGALNCLLAALWPSVIPSNTRNRSIHHTTSTTNHTHHHSHTHTHTPPTDPPTTLLLLSNQWLLLPPLLPAFIVFWSP
jgi:hypothetical protein